MATLQSNSHGWNPTTGWNLVQFTNGSTGVARWTGTGWAWGSLASDVSGLTISNITYLGPTVQALGTTDSGRFQSALRQLSSTATISGLISEIDHGNLGAKGEPVLFDPNGNPVGNTSQTYSEAQSAGLNLSGPGWTGALGDVLNWIGTESNWVRVLEFIGGAVMIGVAMRSLANS